MRSFTSCVFLWTTLSQKTGCFPIVQVTFQSHICHFKKLPWLVLWGTVKVSICSAHCSAHFTTWNEEMCLYLYHLCQVWQLYVWISISKNEAAKSSWDVYIWWMGICWECRHLCRRKASSKRLQVTAKMPTCTKHIMMMHTDLSDDVFLVSKLRFEGWKWGEFDERIILLWTQHCIVEISRFTKTRERDITFGMCSTTPLNTLKKKVEP